MPRGGVSIGKAKISNAGVSKALRSTTNSAMHTRADTESNYRLRRLGVQANNDMNNKIHSWDNEVTTKLLQGKP